MAAVANDENGDQKSTDDACANAGPAKNVDQYEPIGDIETLEAVKDSKSKLTDLEVYYCTELDAKKNITNAVIVMYDIFGWNGKNRNVFELSDKLFTAGKGAYYVLMADHFRKHPYPFGKEVTKEGLDQWKPVYGSYEILSDDMTERLLPHLKGVGVTSISFVGLCWGGLMGFTLGACEIDGTSDLFKGLVSIHGAKITDELTSKLKIPVCYCPTPTDQPVAPVKAILDKKDFAAKCVYKTYENMKHGFTAGRGNYKDEANLEAVNDAVALATEFLYNVLEIKGADEEQKDDK